MAKKKISEFANKPVPVSGDMFLIQDVSTGVYYNVTKAQLSAILGGSQTLQQVTTAGNETTNPIVLKSGADDRLLISPDGTGTGSGDENAGAILLRDSSIRRFFSATVKGLFVLNSGVTDFLFKVDRTNNTVKILGYDVATVNQITGTNSGTNTGDQIISDATITTTDITNNNFTTAKHGFVPKGTNLGYYLKDDGTWAAVAGGVTSVNALTGAVALTGTTNRLTVSAANVFDISAAFEALLGKVANPLSQFAATTSAQLLGIISDKTGSGLLVFATSPTFTTDITTPLIRGVAGNINFLNTIQTSGAVTAYSFTNPANTNQTLSTAITGWRYNGGSRQWATGAITTQIENSWSATTYSFVAASTITNAYGNDFYAPIAGTNAIITNKYSARFNGDVRVICSTANGYDATDIYLAKGAVGFGATPTSTNFAIQGDGQYTVLNAGSGGTIALRVSNGGNLFSVNASTVDSNLVHRFGLGIQAVGQTPLIIKPGATTPLSDFTQGYIFNIGNNVTLPTFAGTYATTRSAAYFGITSVTSTSATTYTDFATAQYLSPVASTNVTVTRLWSIYAESKSLFNQIYIGTTPVAPTALLHIAAGTSTANTAPIQIINGTRETVARGGLTEYENNFYKTNNNLVRYALGGGIKDFITDVASPANTSENDIYTFTTIASTLSVNGDKVDAEYGLQLTSTGGITKQIKVYFGGTAIFDSGALSISASTDFCLNVLIIRDSATTVRCVVTANTTGAATNAFAKVTKVTGLTLSATNILKVTGTVGTGAVSGDVTGILGMVEVKGAA